MIFFIDCSYTFFYRFHALQQWSKHALKEVDDTTEKDQIITDKFKQNYLKTMLDICRQIHHEHTYRDLPKKPRKKPLKETEHLFFWCQDTSRKNIWRTEIFPEYKEGRNNHHDIGSYFKEGLAQIKDYCQKSEHQKNHFMMSHLNLEADDLIALGHKWLRDNKIDRDISIVTSDKDLLQIKDTNTYYWNCKKGGTEWNSDYNGSVDLNLKIIQGDKSDNISGCFTGIGTKKIIDLINNPDKLEELFKQKPEALARYNYNKTLIDFKEIPKKYQLDVRNNMDKLELTFKQKE